MSKSALVAILAVAALLGSGYAWYQSSLERARQEGIAIEMGRRAAVAKAAFDSAVAVHDSIHRADSARIAILEAERSQNRAARLAAAAAAQRATARADSILASLADSIPEIAQVQAAMDTLTQQVAQEQHGRILAEQQLALEQGLRLTAEADLAKAKDVIAEQAATIAQLQKIKTKSGGGAAKFLLGVAAGVGTALLIVLAAP